MSIKKSTDLTGLDSSGRKQLEVHAPDDRNYQLQVMVLDKSLAWGITSTQGLNSFGTKYLICDREQNSTPK